MKVWPTTHQGWIAYSNQRPSQFFQFLRQYPMMGILSTIAWWLGLLYLGATTFLIIKPYFTKLHDHGYAVAKILGLVGFTYILWILGWLKVLPFGQASAIGLALVLGLAAAWQWRRHPQLHVPIRWLVIEEVIFAISLGSWAIVRSYNGRAEGVEKLMDVALVNGLWRTDYFPPTDVWYAAEPVNYYYFGQLMVTALAKLAHVAPQYAVNLGIASTFALCVILTFSLIWQLTRSYLASAISVFLLTLSSNLDPAINAIKKTEDYIFFAATRLDPYTINEFPLYSFVVADLHAHTLGFPLALGIMTVLFVVLMSEKLTWIVVACLSLLLGATGPTNSFDLIIYGGLTGLILLIRQYSQANSWQQSLITAAWQALAIGALSLVLFAPFYLHFNAPVGGIGISLFQTPIDFLLNHFGILLFACLPLAIVAVPAFRFLRQNRSLKDQDGKDSRAELSIAGWYAAALLAMALIAIAATEIIYLKDIYHFQNPPYARANTTFKVFLQAWMMLSLAAGYGIYLSRQIAFKWRLNLIYALGVGALIGLSTIGIHSAITAYRDSKPANQPSWVLDGYAYLRSENPDQLALINFINANIDGQPNVLEAAGESYSQRSRVSAYTGLPTTLGWASHEWGWRYSPTAWDTIASKMGQIEQTYLATDPATMQQLLQEQDISYVVASDVEREQYGLTEFSVLETLAGEPVFEQGNYALYRVKR